MSRWIGLVLAFWLSIAGLSAQESRLAEAYYQNGEYQKAGQLYLKLYTEQPSTDQFFERYIECLMAQEEFREAEQAVRRELRKNPKAVQHYVLLGDLLLKQDRPEEAEKEYRQALRELPADRLQIIKLAAAFQRGMNFNMAAEVYARGGRLLKDPEVFAYNLGDLYRQSGDHVRMVEQYLICLRYDPRRQSTIQMLMQRFLPEDLFPELQAQIFEQISQHPDADVPLIELLTWSFLQQKDYRNALRQSRALDQKLNENGVRLYNLGQIALAERDYSAAREAFSYITDVKGLGSPFYHESMRQGLFAQRQRILSSASYTEAQLRELEADYRRFFDQNGRNRTVAPMMAELAELHALYLYDIPVAIALLEEVVALPGLDRDMQSRAKLQLGDYYLMQGEVWDATLLYAQVDKLYKDDPLGHEARFRNARLSYFNEDFEWAQAQFRVLKASTSKLIANDALDLSVFITDNLGLDTTEDAMRYYARAEMLVFQNRHEDALLMLDSLSKAFPAHTLADDVLYLQAQILIKERRFVQAAVLLEKIAAEFAEDIRADNALYQLAELYAGPLTDTEKAMACYEKIFTDYSNSTFAVDARKQFRRLRGDRIQ